ncbi:MAG: uroporphyrinogen decarboxylase family protein [Armatimonadota bacterium]
MKLNTDEYRQFLAGGPQTRPFAALDPSSYASVFAGKEGGHPSLDDLIAFHKAFPNDATVMIPYDAGSVISEIKWDRKRLREDFDGTVYWEETLLTNSGLKRRVVADRFGTIPWLVEPPIRSADDFELIDFIAERVKEHAGDIAASIAECPAKAREAGMLPAVVIYTAFEVYYLIDYPDMPLFYTDLPETYLTTIERVHVANVALLEAMSAVGVDIYCTGSAGLELLSPRIFQEAIVPFQREFNEAARNMGRFSSYHICGHSKQLIDMKIIDDINPTIFETCSGPPCGNNDDLAASVRGVAEDIITKGNINLELLLEGTPAQIKSAVVEIAEATRSRRHIIGQADATILAGTPTENLHAFLAAVDSLTTSQCG